ncbi:uncharacterized protein LOC123309714 [Coccinella septempunctata]|uniref:uncharacterized protein LOC123309714 n=1 Tax=Coccinella septempunctata TaxID=41139 RepID=UPI001D06C6EB|nr:uncharacterized protein LOC123309714 [Coccinella septempunctata]
MLIRDKFESRLNVSFANMKIFEILFLITLICTLSSTQRCIFPGRYKDYTDPTGRLYYICNQFDGVPIYFRCPVNNVFNALTQVCEVSSNPKRLQCTWIQILLGKTPNPSGDGTTYIDCTDPSLGPRIVACSAGLFSPILMCCYDTAANVCFLS